MQELVSPAQSDKLVMMAVPLIGLICALWAWRTAGQRAAMLALIPALLLYPLWMFHRWITRYDPQTGYFGLDKVWVLLLEVVLFIALGTIVGAAWSKLVRPSYVSTTQEDNTNNNLTHRQDKTSGEE